ncbi:hypothetical protein [Rhodothermus profundi]|uniref:Uncharacterized protein n=1 Tax=Rhodothermus profundi TaxID=633813 RepID=A0A1M6TXR4_9BACT|nr:hypothetical protein [Rhodothermus profundi]SHK61822.1 hypothetical protein SAMN04488087_1583 [Rhodothermus profundi]
MIGFGQLLRNWVVYTLVFLICGGIGAGLTNLLFEWIVGREFDPVLYAIIFGGTGWIGYRQAESGARMTSS